MKVMASVAALRDKKITIQKAYLLSCVNGRVDDLAEAATVLKGRRIASGVEALRCRGLAGSAGRKRSAR